MANALGHSIFGGAAAIVLVSLLNMSIETKIIAGLIAFGFAFLPDIDHPKAVARQIYKKGGRVLMSALFFILLWQFAMINFWISIIASAILSITFIQLSEMLFPKHRGITHKMWFGIIAGAAFYAVLAYMHISYAITYAISGFVGYASHIILDSI